MVELEEQIKVVVEARGRLGSAVAVKNAIQAEYEADNKDMFDAIKVVSNEVDKAESLLRELTLLAFAETGDKAPAVGVGIREVTKLEYDGKVAFDWAKAHKMALKLDTKAFEKIAKVSPPDFVKIITEPQATIATNLEIKEGE